MTPPRPSGIAPLLASLVIGAILACTGVTFAVDALRAAMPDRISGPSGASVAPAVDVLPSPLPAGDVLPPLLPAADVLPPLLPTAAALEPPLPAAAPEPPSPAAAAPGTTDGAAPDIPIQRPILPKATPAARQPEAGAANAQAPAQPARQTTSRMIAAVAAAANAERAAAGCRALRVDDRLNAAAQRHSVDMANRRNMSHSGRNGSKFTDRIRAAGYPRPGAENIAVGQPTAASVVADWMASAGHRRNILNCAYRAIGVGFDSRGNYWTQNFGL